MKLSGFNEPFKTETIETLKRFLNQLIQAGDNWGLHIVKYLFFINAGGAAALLGYMGAAASKDIPITMGLKISLICLFLGISSVGALLSTMLYGARRSFNKLSENGEQYFQDKLDWEILLKNTKIEHSKTLKWADLFGWSSSAFFTAGTLIALFSLIDFKLPSEKIFIILGALCLIAGPILKDKSRSIIDEQGRRVPVHYIQNKFLYILGLFLMGIGVVLNILGLAIS